MKNLSRRLVGALAITVTACASPPPQPSSPATAAFAADMAAPPGRARVYILPTLSKTIYSDPEGRAGIAIRDDGDGARLAWTGQTTFVAFDLPPGRYTLMADAEGAFAHFARSLRFAAGTVYFLRPTFFASTADLTQGNAKGGMDFEPVAPVVGRAEVRRMDMAALTAEGQAFLAQVRSAPPPGTSLMPDTSLATVERKLRELRQLHQDGLITTEEFDAKRRAILDGL